MSLLYGVLSLSVSAVLLRALFIISRMPAAPRWIHQGMAHVGVLAVTGLIALGVIYVLDFLFTFKDQAFGIGTLLATLGIAAAGAVVWKLLERWTGGPPTLTIVPSTPTGDGPSTIPPERPRKAA